jgi:carbon-monoxide dehydrogenase medium subunit
MIPASFDYVAPKTIRKAISLLQQHGSHAKVLAGGHSLLPAMKLRLAAPQVLIDINRIPALDYLKESGGYLHIGTLAREAALDESDLIQSRYPILADTVKVIADPLVRNMATVGGNLAHGDPANDHPATMLALGAEVVATGPTGKRTIPIESFFVDAFQTALQPDEILTEIRVPMPKPRSGGAYMKLERKVGDFAIAGVAAQLTLDESGSIKEAGIGLTNVGLTAIKARKTEDFLRGKKPEQAVFKQAGQLAAAEAQPAADLRGPEEYKRAMVRVLTFRALKRAVERAQAGG